MNRKWDVNDIARRDECRDDVIARVQEITDPENVGIVAAQDIIDIVLNTLGPEIYNKGINDATAVVVNKASDTENELTLLLQ